MPVAHKSARYFKSTEVATAVSIGPVEKHNCVIIILEPCLSSKLREDGGGGGRQLEDAIKSK